MNLDREAHQSTEAVIPDGSTRSALADLVEPIREPSLHIDLMARWVPALRAVAC
jgi:hypothetical protein